MMAAGVTAWRATLSSCWNRSGAGTERSTNEAAIEKAGAAPLKPGLDAIAGLRTKADLAPLLGRMHLESGGGATLFGFGSSQDFADSNSVIAFAVAGGLGLPDRDYYVSPDSGSVRTREEYRTHLARMFRLLGEAPNRAARSGDAVMLSVPPSVRSPLTSSCSRPRP